MASVQEDANHADDHKHYDILLLMDYGPGYGVRVHHLAPAPEVEVGLMGGYGSHVGGHDYAVGRLWKVYSESFLSAWRSLRAAE